MNGSSRFLAALVVGLTFLGAGCGPLRVEVGDTPSVPSAPFAVPADAPTETKVIRDTLAGDIEHVSYSFSTSSRVHLELYSFPQDQYQFRLVNGEPKTMAGWREALPERVIAGINAMYFLEDFSPAGFFVAEGIESRTHPFDWDVSALFIVDENGRVQIRPTTTEPTDIAAFTQAAQSYPLLVLNGSPLLTEDSGKVSRRSIIGIDKNGRAWIGVVVDGDVSLYRLGQLLMDIDIPWQHVLNLDGGTSSGMFLRGEETIFYPSLKSVPSVILIEKR